MMQPQTPNTPTNSRTIMYNPDPSTLQSLANSPSVRQSREHWLQPLMSRLSVGNKIIFGYALALGIAVTGTTVGFIVGNHYETQAREQAEHGHEEGVLLGNLQVAILQARSHQQQFSALIPQPKEFQHEYSHFLKHLGRLKTLMSAVKAAANTSKVEGLKEFLQTHNDTVDAYWQELDGLLKQIEPLNLEPGKISQAQQLLLKFSSSEAALKLDNLSDDLTELAEVAFEEEETAEHGVNQAVNLRTQIVVASMLLSLVIAALLALATSRAISRPIEAVTTVAKRVTQEENFDLQADVSREDEIGVLATSLNQLIHQVKYLLEKQKVEAERQLIQSEKMSSLGRMLAGVAHEINNPVNFIYGNLIHAEEYVEELIAMLDTYSAEVPNPPQVVTEQAEDMDLEFLKEDLPKVLQSMKVGADRVRQIVLSLKNFSRLDETAAHEVDLHACLDSTILILNNRIKKDIIVVRNYGDIPAVEGYSGLLYQVFMNLLSNAVDALEEQTTDSSPQQIVITTERLDRDWVVVRIADTGTGIAPENQAKIFDTFFTTKPRGIGTGLGLAITHQIVVEKHGGTITVESQQGQGTEFVITLPTQKSTTENLFSPSSVPSPQSPVSV